MFITPIIISIFIFFDKLEHYKRFKKIKAFIVASLVCVGMILLFGWLATSTITNKCISAINDYEHRSELLKEENFSNLNLYEKYELMSKADQYNDNLEYTRDQIKDIGFVICFVDRNLLEEVKTIKPLDIKSLK
jgi:predicted PurR-regulated permease PerM